MGVVQGVLASSREGKTATDVLTHYDPKLPLRLAADASQYGLGAVISHVMPHGGEKPIAFASRSLSPSEKNYLQIDKEALALIFGVQKFHMYVYGRQFTLVTATRNYTGTEEWSTSSSGSKVAEMGHEVGSLQVRH